MLKVSLLSSCQSLRVQLSPVTVSVTRVSAGGIFCQIYMIMNRKIREIDPWISVIPLMWACFTRVTCQPPVPRHASQWTFHALMESWLNLPLSLSLSNDIWAWKNSFFYQRYETSPVIYFYLSSKIFSIYIFNIRIKNSNNGVIYLLRTQEGRSEWDRLPFTGWVRAGIQNKNIFLSHFTLSVCCEWRGLVYW